MTDLQIIAIAFFVIGLLAYFFGEALPITLLLAWLTWQWIIDQPDRPYAIVQAGLAWALWVVICLVADAAWRLHKRLKFWRQYTEYQAAKAQNV